MFALAVQVPLGAHEVCVDRIAPRPIQIYVRKWDLTLSWTGAVSGCLFESYDLNNVSQSYFFFFFFRGKRKKSKASSISEMWARSFHNASSTRLQVLGQIRELKAFSSHNLGPVGNVNRKCIVAMQSVSST